LARHPQKLLRPQATNTHHHEDSTQGNQGAQGNQGYPSQEVQPLQEIKGAQRALSHAAHPQEKQATTAPPVHLRAKHISNSKRGS